MRTQERINQLVNINGVFKKYDMREFMKFCTVGEHRILEKTRREEILMNRQLACVFGYANNMTLIHIGEVLGGIDHATVLHSIKVVFDDFIYGKKMKQLLNKFCENIEGYNSGCNIHLSAALCNLENKFFNNQIQ